MQHVSFRLDRVNTLERHRSPAAFNRLGLSKARTLGSGTPPDCNWRRQSVRKENGLERVRQRRP